MNPTFSSFRSVVPVPGPVRIGRWVLALLGTVVAPALAEDALPRSMDSAFIVSPLVGPIHDEVKVHGSPGAPEQTLEDNSVEYGLFAMYATPRFIANNTLFNSRVNEATVWGDILTLNLYGPTAAKATWYLGAAYLWHEIDGDPADILVTEPMPKAGFLFRIPTWHLSVNPFVGYGWQRVETDVETPRGTVKDTERTDSILYGISAYWRWRMLYANAKYTLEDNRDRNEQYHVFRFWGTAMFTETVGILTRIEYAEQSTSTDTSALFGPVFLF